MNGSHSATSSVYTTSRCIAELFSYIMFAAAYLLFQSLASIVYLCRKVVMAHSERRNVVSTVYGGSGGDHWDDGLYHGVTEITLRSGACIDSFSVVYHINGAPIKATEHGGAPGNETKITLDSKSNEVLKTVSGSVGVAYWKDTKPLVIRSLKFDTNQRELGPYGEEAADRKFTFTVKDGDKIIGFFGRSSEFLDAIGFHVTHP